MPPIKMTNLFERPARWLACLATAVLMTGCGPGTGGTGTGPIGVTLGFSGGTGASTAAPGTGCTTDCAQTGLRLDTERVELAGPCLRFVSTGPWGVDTTGLAILTGTAETGGATAPNVTLRLQFSGATADSTQVTLTLVDSAGKALAGPLTLLRNDTAVSTAPPACQPQ